MRCPACGAEVVEQAVYCHKCGERLDATGDAPAPAPAASDESRSPGADFVQNAAAAGDRNTEPEKEVWRGGFSPKAMIGGWALSALITVILLTIGIVWVHDGWYWMILVAIMLLPWIYHIAILGYRRLSVHYLLTTQRFIHESGVLRRVTNRIEAIDMDDITFEQNLLERLVGVGTIRILSTDRTDPQIILRGIDNVKRVSELFDDARRVERRRRGVHIEQI